MDDVMNPADHLVIVKEEVLDYKQGIKSENVDNFEIDCACDKVHSTYEQTLCPVAAVKQENLTCEHIMRDDIKQEMVDSADPDYLFHDDSSPGSDYVCPDRNTCSNKRFTYKSAYIQDLNSCHPSLNMHFCTKCDALYGSKMALKYHVRKKHRDMSSPHCPVAAIKQEDLTFEHMRNDINQEMVDSADPDYLFHDNSSPGSDYVCPDKNTCSNKRFTYKSAYIQHLNSCHPSLNMHFCNKCDALFGSKMSLKFHFQKQHRDMCSHTGKRPYECDLCGKIFTASSSFKKHMLTHTSEKPYECDVCKKCFTYSRSLRAHMCIHTGSSIHLLQDTCLTSEIDEDAGTYLEIMPIICWEPELKIEKLMFKDIVANGENTRSELRQKRALLLTNKTPS